MITTRQRQFLSPILEWAIIPTDTLVYFEEQLRLRLHSVILDAFKRRVKERGLTQKQLAKRIHRSPVTVNRWLSTASNLTLDSIAVLMIGLGMDFDSFPFSPIEKTISAETQQVNSEQMDLGEPSKKGRFGIMSPTLDWGKMVLSPTPSITSATTALALLSNSGTTASMVKELQERASPKLVGLASWAQQQAGRDARKKVDPNKILGIRGEEAA